MKISCQFLWNIQNFVLSGKQSVWRKKRHVFGTLQFWPKSLCPDLTGVPFFGWFWVFFEMLKIPFQFFWNIQNFVLSWKQSVWRKKGCSGDFSIWTKIAVSGLTGVAIFWLLLSIFGNFENTLPILVKHSKICSFMKTISFKKKSMFWELFNFRQNRGIRTLPEWPFFGWFWEFFGMMKISCQLLWNIQNFVLLWIQSVSRKKSMFWELFNFWQNRCIRTVPAWPFFVDFEYFLKC